MQHMESYPTFRSTFNETPTAPDGACEPPPERSAAVAAAAPASSEVVTAYAMVETPGTTTCTNGEVMGVLEVFIHQARDIHNICIYHKQDVYAKLCLTSNSHLTVSTRIINGGGRNPVFNDTLRLNVPTIDSSLKCEIWMLSRARNYLEDQLLGFALVPLSDVVLATNSKLAQEFSLSSTDLFHSPAGFVQLSISYQGSSPDVMAITDTTLPGACSAAPDIPASAMLNKIEFPDLKVVNENQLMVSEYFGIPCSTLESQSPESLIAFQNGAHLSVKDDAAGVRVVESFYTDSNGAALKHEHEHEHEHEREHERDTPLSGASATNGELPATSNSITGTGSAETGASPSLEDKSTDVSENDENDVDSSSRGGGGGGGSVLADNGFPTPIIKFNIEELEETVKQQEIVDMYMKSMQQFTESLAKMKLPMDIENGSSDAQNDNHNSENKPHASKGTGPRVFYGSRAFF
ncbi:hypothetical protein J5N97_008362 [Dioscorea zingiberensis]|uniref:C2 domain-containing protein n=1 Tax=Dioscorea zingiberensis TaxID=325984 RepID=A0A9D5CW60_9LILI|nr:hypothetical protein J5N97_008362 [Dioscorea zingiberensis]